MLLLIEDKILIKTRSQKKGYWERKVTVEFPNKIYTLSGFRCTNGNRGHRLSGQEGGNAAGQRV